MAAERIRSAAADSSPALPPPVPGPCRFLCPCRRPIRHRRHCRGQCPRAVESTSAPDTDHRGRRLRRLSLALSSAPSVPGAARLAAASAARASEPVWDDRLRRGRRDRAARTWVSEPPWAAPSRTECAPASRRRCRVFRRRRRRRALGHPPPARMPLDDRVRHEEGDDEEEDDQRVHDDGNDRARTPAFVAQRHADRHAITRIEACPRQISSRSAMRVRRNDGLVGTREARPTHKSYTADDPRKVRPPYPLVPTRWSEQLLASRRACPSAARR